MSRLIYRISEHRYWLSDTPQEGKDITCEEISLDSVEALDIARLLDNALEESNKHEIAGIYEIFYDLVRKHGSISIARSLFREIYEKGGLFNA